jgi:EAL domain-containing protein (putative c-di-GMP-specific phosphodiesterase class I)
MTRLLIPAFTEEGLLYRLKRLVADQALDMLILKEAARPN